MSQVMSTDYTSGFARYSALPGEMKNGDEFQDEQSLCEVLDFFRDRCPTGNSKT